ncbi:cnh domain containing [Anaeramoeba flamelloides]|uniref:Cnh domain containing n=1 Tax=Anaeramoeba flamelloides TaxID=1746091 RepID=A0ABQ8YBQ5_9EUKA|nr:cnh domain containing [Anaeramoeba flamelloides]
METHCAFEYSLIIKNIGKIETLETWNNNLVVSLNNGSLIQYQVDQISKNFEFQATEIKRIQKFTKKGITQMSIVQPKNILIALFDSTVQLFNLKTMKPLNILCSKKALIFSYNKRKTLCIGLKTKLLIFKWKNNTFQKTIDVPITAVPKTLEWFKATKICIGFKKEYILMNLRDNSNKQLFALGKNSQPISTKISDEEILLGKEKICIFQDPYGKAPRAYGITWVDSPKNIFYFQPYVLGMFSQDIRVRTLNTKRLVQNIEIPETISFCYGENENIRFGYTFNKEGIWRLNEIPLLVQVDMLCSEANYEEALQLCQLVDTLDTVNKKEKFNTIKIDYAFYLFNKRKFVQAMEYFHEVGCDPRIVLSLFPSLVPPVVSQGFSIPTIKIKKLDENEQLEAIFGLIDYLQQTRNSPNIKTKQNSLEILKVIDTTLIRSYIQTNISYVTPFLRLPNYCDLEECEKLFVESELKSELIELYKTNEKHEKSLILIEKESKKSGDITTFVEYLCLLGKEHLELIFEYSKKLYQINPNKCLKVFIYEKNDKEEFMENQISSRGLPRMTVKKFIQENLPNLIIPYLEYVIFQKKDSTQDFHNDLLLFYYEQIQYLEDLLKNTLSDKKKINKLQITKNKIIEKINIFAKNSKYYLPQKMLDSFPKNRFYEERAIFLSRVGKYEMALDIYVNKLNDLGKAENYCIEHYHKDGKTQNIFSLFIKKLLSNNNNKYQYKNKDNTTENINDNDKTRLTNYIINIINEHYTKINPLDVIKLLPKKLNLSKILDYLILIIQKTTEVKRRCQITKNLEKSDNLNLKSKISKKSKRQFYIDQNVLCMSCGKRIGNSIIGIFPNGVYAHMSCIQNKHVCPKTNENFSDYSENFY